MASTSEELNFKFNFNNKFKWPHVASGDHIGQYRYRTVPFCFFFFFMTLTGVFLICSFIYNLPFNPLGSPVNSTSKIFSKSTYFPPTFTVITLLQATVTPCMDNSNSLNIGLLASILATHNPSSI